MPTACLLVITKRRVGLAARDIKDAIDRCDVSKLPGELAELLLKFLPTKDEVCTGEVSGWVIASRPTSSHHIVMSQ